MSKYTLSFYSTVHDGSTSIFKDDQLIFFVHSERFSRIKSGLGTGTKLLQYISENITNEIDLLCNFSPIQLDESGLNFKKIINPYLSRERAGFNLIAVDSQLTHHNSHAYSAFYLSPFKEAVCLVIDGFGNSFKVLNNDGLGILGTETTSIIQIKENYDIKTLYKRLFISACSRDRNYDIQGGLRQLSLNKKAENFNGIFKELPYKLHASYSVDIGFMYDVITEHLGLHSRSGGKGYGIGGFGKTMGLSAYGNPINNLPDFLIENTIESNKNLFTSTSELNFSLYPELFDKKNLNFQTKADLAYECQKSLETVFLHHAKFIKENSKIKNLIICGGCCLNILGVSKIKEMFPEFNIFVDPIGNDATHSIGRGIYAYKKYINNDVVKRNNFNSIYLGSEYKEDKIINEINDWMKQYETP